MVHTFGGALGRHLPVFPEEAGQFQFLQMVFQLAASTGLFMPSSLTRRVL